MKKSKFSPWWYREYVSPFSLVWTLRGWYLLFLSDNYRKLCHYSKNKHLFNIKYKFFQEPATNRESAQVLGSALAGPGNLALQPGFTAHRCGSSYCGLSGCFPLSSHILPQASPSPTPGIQQDTGRAPLHSLATSPHLPLDVLRWSDHTILADQRQMLPSMRVQRKLSEKERNNMLVNGEKQHSGLNYRAKEKEATKFDASESWKDRISNGVPSSFMSSLVMQKNITSNNHRNIWMWILLFQTFTESNGDLRMLSKFSLDKAFKR